MHRWVRISNNNDARFPNAADQRFVSRDKGGATRDEAGSFPMPLFINFQAMDGSFPEECPQDSSRWAYNGKRGGRIRALQKGTRLLGYGMLCDIERVAADVIEIPVIITSRLKLISLSIDCLRAMFDGDFVSAGASVGFTVSPSCSLLKHSSIPRRINLILKDPEQHPWMYRAIVRRSDTTMVGHISFHHKAPDPDLLEYSSYAAELGYTIETGQRRRGYAEESVRGMMGWANRQGVATFLLSISPDNIPSIGLAEKIGFRKISERIDETDGLEYVYISGMGANDKA